MNTIARLERALKLGQPIMLDAYEVQDVMFHLEDLGAALKEAEAKYLRLLDQSVSFSRETSGLLLKAVLAGAFAERTKGSGENF